MHHSPQRSSGPDLCEGLHGTTSSPPLMFFPTKREARRAPRMARERLGIRRPSTTSELGLVNDRRNQEEIEKKRCNITNTPRCRTGCATLCFSPAVRSMRRHKRAAASRQTKQFARQFLRKKLFCFFVLTSERRWRCASHFPRGR